MSTPKPQLGRPIVLKSPQAIETYLKGKDIVFYCSTYLSHASDARKVLFTI